MTEPTSDDGSDILLSFPIGWEPCTCGSPKCPDADKAREATESGRAVPDDEDEGSPTSKRLRARVREDNHTRELGRSLGAW